MQNDFLPPDGKLAVTDGRTILPPIRELLDKSLNWPWTIVVASQDYHPPGHISFVTSHPSSEGKVFQAIKVTSPRGDEIDQILWPEHCIQGTAGCELERSVQEALVDWQSRGLYYLVQKGTDKHADAYSAFASPSMPSVRHAIETGITRASASQSSPLSSYLSSRGVVQLVIVGIATDVCVRATAEDALACGFGVVLIEQAMKGVDLENSEEMLVAFKQRKGAKVFANVKEVYRQLV